MLAVLACPCAPARDFNCFKKEKRKKNLHKWTQQKLKGRRKDQNHMDHSQEVIVPKGVSAEVLIHKTCEEGVQLTQGFVHTTHSGVVLAFGDWPRPSLLKGISNHIGLL